MKRQEQQKEPRVEITLSSLKQKSKPSSKDYPKIYQTFEKKIITMQQLKVAIAHGQAFAPCIFKENWPKNNHFLYTSTLALDFDDNQDWQKIVEQLKEVGFKPNIYYPTWSCTDNYKRFRIVLFLDEKITDTVIFKQLMKSLIYLTGADENGVKISQFYQGSFDATVLDYQVTNLKEVILWCDSVDLWSSETTKYVHRNKFKALFPKTENFLKRNKKQNFNYEIACRNSKVFKGFYLGKTELKYKQLRNLVSNCVYIKGGLPLIKEKMDLCGTYKTNDYQLLHTIPKYNYFPEQITSFDSSLNGKFKNILALEKEIFIPLKKVKNDSINQVEEKLYSFLVEEKPCETGVFLIKAQTGLGKTQAIIAYMTGNTDRKFLLALKTHTLIDEVYERFSNPSVAKYPFFNLPFFKKEHLDKIEKLGSVKAFSDTLLESKAYAQFIPEHKMNLEYLEKYSIEHSDFLKFGSKVSLITHKKFLNLMQTSSEIEDNFSEIVIDEDFFNLIFPIHSLPTTQWFELANEMKIIISTGQLSNGEMEKNKRVRQDLINLLAYVNSLIPSQVVQVNFPVPSSPSKFKALLGKINYGHKLLAIMECGFISQTNNELLGIEKPIPEDKFKKKITVMSATADPFFYENVYPNLKFKQFEMVENKQPIIQYSNYMYSKNQMRRKNCPFPNVGNSLVITYKEFKHLFPEKNRCDLHFGNLEGLDCLKGMDISFYCRYTYPYSDDHSSLRTFDGVRTNSE